MAAYLMSVMIMWTKFAVTAGQLVERLRVRLLSGRSEVQILGRSHRLATAATFRKKLCCPGAMTRRWTLQTRYTLQRNAASIMNDLI